MTQSHKQTVLREIAFSRSGDKGDIINVSVIPYDPAAHWDLVREQITVDVVRKLYAGLAYGSITRYELPGTHALNFVLESALAGGVSTTLRVDGHGKAMQSIILEAPITVPPSTDIRSGSDAAATAVH